MTNPNPKQTATTDPHAGHEHFSCACGESFHSQEELKAHARQFHGK